MMARLRVEMSYILLVVLSSFPMNGHSQEQDVTYLGGLVFAGSDEVGPVSVELDVVDLVVEFVGLDVFELFTGLQIVNILTSLSSFSSFSLFLSPPIDICSPSSHTG